MYMPESEMLFTVSRGNLRFWFREFRTVSNQYGTKIREMLLWCKLDDPYDGTEIGRKELNMFAYKG